MSDRAERLARLSPEKRARLERALLARREATLDRERIRRRAPGEDAPLSFPQQRLWFFDRMAPGDPTYNAVVAMALRGPLDIDRLRRAFALVVERHEAVRTVFPDHEGIPYQHVLDEWELALPVVDLRACSEAERGAEVAALLRDAPRAPYDLRHDLMLRLLVARTGDDEHVLLIMEHHIAFDGWSDDVLCAEVSECYRALGDGRAPVLAELPVQYGDFAAWQQSRLDDDRLAGLRSFWKSYLLGSPALTALPIDFERPRRQTFVGARAYVDVGPEVNAPIAALCRAESATPFMVLLAAFDALLCRWAGLRDISVGTPIANRGRVELEPLIGFFSNTLVVRCRPEPSHTLRDLVRAARDSALAAYEHQDLPFDKIVEVVAPIRNPAHNPLFQVNFRVTSGTSALLDLPGVEAMPVAADIGFARFDLALELQPTVAGLGGYLEYNVALFEPGTARALVDAFSVLLRDALSRPDAPIGDLELAAATSAGGIRGARRRG